jgi:large subunit ribosomal protein L18
MRIKTKEDRRDRIKFRIRKKMAGTAEKPRLSVFRSVSHIYVQVIDDLSGQTIASASTIDPKVKGQMPKGVAGGNINGAELIGTTIAERLKEKGITKVVFDRNGFLYHGRVRAVAEAARTAGREFLAAEAQRDICEHAKRLTRHSSTSRTRSSRSTASPRSSRAART